MQGDSPYASCAPQTCSRAGAAVQHWYSDGPDQQSGEASRQCRLAAAGLSVLEPAWWRLAAVAIGLATWRATRHEPASATLLPGLRLAQHRATECPAVQLHRPCRSRFRLDVSGLPAADHLPAGTGSAHGGTQSHPPAGYLHRPVRQPDTGVGQTAWRR